MERILLFQIPRGKEWIVVALLIIAVLFWLKVLIELINNKTIDDTSKIIWLIIVFFLGFIGALIYIFFGKKTKPNRIQGQ